MLHGERVAEHVVAFAPSVRFDAARAAGCFGAAPLRDALTRLAPYRYARRFARGRTVRIDAPDAVGGWALLRAAGTITVAPARRDAEALAWYGDAPSAHDLRADVAIVGPDGDAGDAACVLRLDDALRDGAHGDAHAVEIVDPLPLDVGITFDPAEGPARRWFAVERAPEPAPRALPDVTYRAAGGSAGRIAVILGRNGALLQPSADTDEARALVAALRAEGFDAMLAESPEELDGADLVHAIGTRDGRRVRSIVDAARRRGIPVALHAHDEDAAHGGWWGADVTRYCFEYGGDEHDVQTYLALLAKRAVSVGAARADVPFAPPEAAVDDAAAALRDASVVFAATDEEADAIRRRTGRRGPIVIVPPLAAAVALQPVGHLAGADRFVLLHAPIAPPGNALLVARCAALAELPLVVTGPVIDASYLERVREFGGPGLVVLAGEPAPGVAAGLRAAAGVRGGPGLGGRRRLAARGGGARGNAARAREPPPVRGARRRRAPLRSRRRRGAHARARRSVGRCPARARAPRARDGRRARSRHRGARDRGRLRGHRGRGRVMRPKPGSPGVRYHHEEDSDEHGRSNDRSDSSRGAGRSRAASRAAGSARAAGRRSRNHRTVPTTRRCTARFRIWSAAVRTSPCSSGSCTAPTRS